MMSEKALAVQGLVKHYKGFSLGPIDLELEPGTVLGLIGPNGAGKTTLLSSIIGLVRADGGSATVYGLPNDPDRVDWKQMIGYVGDEPAFYERWSGARNLKFASQFYPEWDDDQAYALAARFKLDLGKKVREMSRGNRVKLALIMALAHNPRLCLFDEPTSGLDPVVRDEVLELLYEMMGQGKMAILYSTHILTDLARLADDLVFLSDGTLLLRTPKEEMTETWRRISFRHTGDTVKLPGIVTYKREGADHIVMTRDREGALATLREQGIDSIEESRLTLDDIAVQILRGGLHVGVDDE